MKPTKRTILILVLVAILLAVPATVLAGKLIYKARLTTAQETVPVVGSDARGSLIFGTDPDGNWIFKLKVRDLSGPVGGAHIHGPAGYGQAAGIVFTLCGNPQPGAVLTCDVKDGKLKVEGNFDPSMLRGITAEQFMEYLNSGMLYVNVHTGMNPAGESRGQIHEH